MIRENIRERPSDQSALIRRVIVRGSDDAVRIRRFEAIDCDEIATRDPLFVADKEEPLLDVAEVHVPWRLHVWSKG